MKAYNIRLSENEMKILSNMISQEFVEYYSNNLIYTNEVYGIIGLKVENQLFKLTNFTEPIDYYGQDEDVGMFKIAAAIASDIESYLVDEPMNANAVKQKIEKIKVINEVQKLYKNDDLIYEYDITRGIIFVLENGKEISFEKSVWFSEGICIDKGEKLENRFSTVQEFVDDWNDKSDYRATCERSIIELV